MTKRYLEEIVKLAKQSSVDKRTYHQFIQRLKKGTPTKEDSPSDHICVFFLPIDKKLQQIYLCHHIKAADWIPPGGHIKKDEHPTITVKRESLEELGYLPIDNQIKLFDLSIKHIVNPKYSCKYHYDIWYLIDTDKREFVFTKKEYYDAGWFTIQQANRLIRFNPDYLKIVNKIAI